MFHQFGATTKSLSKASKAVFQIGTDVHLYDDSEDVNIAPLLDNMFNSETANTKNSFLVPDDREDFKNNQATYLAVIADADDVSDEASFMASSQDDLFGEIDKAIAHKRKEFVKQGLLKPNPAKEDITEVVHEELQPYQVDDVEEIERLKGLAVNSDETPGEFTEDGDLGSNSDSLFDLDFDSLVKSKKVHELSKSGSDIFKAENGDERITCAPIHVFENIKDDTSSLDWRNWTFLRNSTHVNGVLASSNSSVYEGSVECLNFDKLLSTLHLLGASNFHSLCPENLQETSLPNLILQKEQTKNAKVDLELDILESHVLGGLIDVFQENRRSYYVGCKDKPEGNLWACKYKTTKVIEVCGSDEAVNFLSDWLHQWHERRYNPSKETSNRDTRVMQDDDYYMCSGSDYDLEDMNEDDSL
ncbi:hypothetical protein RYX36_016872 [Vicia faba]